MESKKSLNFNVFRMHGVDCDAGALSKILAEFLDPDASHNMGDSPFFYFANYIHVDDDTGDALWSWDDFDEDNFKVHSEYATDEGVIDILMEDDHHNTAIVFKSNVGSTDQFEQLKKYDEWGRKKYGEGKYILVYLTLYQQSDDAPKCEGVKYVEMSYEKDVANLMGMLELNFREYPYLTALFQHYRDFIGQLL